MYKIHHPNIVKLFSHFEDNYHCYFIMEYVSKGNVENLLTLNKKKQLDTKVVASIIKDVISATYFLHNMNPPIIHRDIKPENVLLNSLNDGIVAKLTDFGCSKYIEKDKGRKTILSTPINLAPEIIYGQEYDEKVDIWCIGVLLYELITGCVPFKSKDLNNLNLKINWPKEMNKDAKDLISKILKFNPSERITLKEMLEHPFFTKYFPDAQKSLILPDPNIIYKTFIVSKDDPNTWGSVKKNSNMLGPLGNQKNKEPQEKYTKEKQPEIEDKDLKIKYNDLKNENNDLRNKVLALEQKIKEQQIQSFDNKLNEFKNSLACYGEDYDLAFEDLKKHLDKEIRQNFNEKIRNKDEEIEKYKREEKARREKEKQKYINLINKYDKVLGLFESENEELKRKIKELETKLPKN